MNFFFFKQKTAYEMRISDWSSDVCSSDLVGLGDLLGEARQIEKPLTLHIAEKDRFSSPEEITKVREALESNGKATTHLYKGQDHAFARPGGEHYDAASAKLANERTINFFKEHLA